MLWGWLFVLLLNLSLKITKSYKIVTEHGELYFPLVQFVVRYYNVRMKVVQTVQILVTEQWLSCGNALFTVILL